MASRWARVARALLAAVFSTLVAAGSHVIAGGSVSGAGLAIAMVFSALVCIALTGKRLSRVRLAASVGISQFAFHSVFGLVGSGGTVVSTGHHAILSAPDAAAAAPTSLWMVAAHAAAAIVTTIVLQHGEAALWRLRELVILLVRVAIVGPVEPTVSGRVREPRSTVFCARFFVLNRASLRYRGPPAAFVG
jgi:hypothetical protein